MTTAQIENPCLFIKPSKTLYKFVTELVADEDTPVGILNIIKSDDNLDSNKRKLTDPVYLLKEDDYAFMNSLDSDSEKRISASASKLGPTKNDKLLNLEDLRWIYKKIEEGNASSKEKTYFHEIFEGSEVILPQNAEIPRNPELEKRCTLLKAQQQNKQYKAMTKNVDNVRQKHPEDTIAYQSEYYYICF